MEHTYENFQYEFDMPTGVQYIGETDTTTSNILSLIETNKKAAVILVHKGVFKRYMSSHKSIELAHKKASQLERADKDIDNEYFAVELRHVSRTLTVFTKDGWYGNASDTVAMDTAWWTIAMWSRMRWYWKHPLELAKHYNDRIHEYKPIAQYDYDLKKNVTAMRCDYCNLTEEELGLK